MTQAAKQQTEPQAIEQRDSVQLTRERMMEAVSERIQQLTGGAQLATPEDYQVGNAVAAWWLRLQQPIEAGRQKGKTPLELATRESVITATLDMVVQGLDPALDQVYPIVYGDRLAAQRSYFGTLAMLKRLYPGNRSPRAVVVYEGDDLALSYVDGVLEIKHQPGPQTGTDGKEIGAYAVLDLGNGDIHREWMPMAQIRRAWNQGAANGSSPAHKGFAGEMAKKTVLSRAAKIAIKSSGHSHLVQALERQEVATAELQIEAEASEGANQQLVGLAGDVDEQKPKAIEAPVQPVAGLDDDEKRLVEEHEARVAAAREEQGIEKSSEPGILFDDTDTDEKEAPGF